MNDEQDIYENYRKYQEEERQKHLSENADLINSFIKFCKTKGVELTSENFDYIQTIGIVANYPNIVHKLNAKIDIDKEQLVSVKVLETEFQKKGFIPGYLYSENYIVMAHPYFRRGHHKNSNFAPHFVAEFWRYNKTENDKYLAVDFDRVRINVDESSYMELDHWQGPMFKNDIEDIKDDIVKYRPPLLADRHISFLFNSVYSLDIKWHTKDNLKSFQAEEFKTADIRIEKDGKEYYPVKYLHAQFDLNKKNFIHFDGAIHFYTEEEYYQRRDQDFNYNNKNAVKQKPLSQKLFKINGSIDTKDWINLVGHFLQGNHLVFEYFEGKFPDRIQEMLNAISKKSD